MSIKLSAEQRMVQRRFEGNRNVLVNDISLMESSRMNMRDLVKHYIKYRQQELKYDDNETLQEKYEALQEQNSYCPSCTIEVTKVDGKCPYCGTKIDSI